MEAHVFRALFLLLVFAVLVHFPVSSSQDDYCTADGCPSDETDLQEIGETSFQWWDLWSASKYIIQGIIDSVKYNLYRKFQQVKNATSNAVEVLKNATSSAVDVLKDVVNTGVQKLYNQTAKAAEAIYNKTAEYAGEIYEKLGEFAEQVRVVVKEELSALEDSFFAMLWEDGSWGNVDENDSQLKKWRKQVIQWVLTFVVVALCLLLDYIIWKLFYYKIEAVFHILSFNSAVFLVYQWTGPMWVLWGFWKVVETTTYLSILITKHPTISAITVCAMWVTAVIYSCWRKGYQQMSYIQPSYNTNTLVTKMNEMISAVDEIRNELKVIKREMKEQHKKMVDEMVAKENRRSDVIVK